MVDITAIANEAGLKLRALLTLAAWDIFSDRSQIQGRDLNIRLSRVVDTLRIALTQRKGPKENIIKFSTVLEPRGNLANKSVLIAAVENRARAQSVIKIMLPEEVGGEISKEGDLRGIISFGDLQPESNSDPDVNR